jgi:hypothetical protein
LTGVTANLCVIGRATKRVVWFSDHYPRTGGGEDVDFCLRIKDLIPLNTRDEVVVAVPEARVVHPFWQTVTRQVVGWALGDVLCLSQLPTKFVLFLAFPLHPYSFFSKSACVHSPFDIRLLWQDLLRSTKQHRVHLSLGYLFCPVGQVQHLAMVAVLVFNVGHGSDFDCLHIIP